MKRNTFKQVFGNDEEWYRQEIKKALECEGKYASECGFIHSGIVLWLQGNLSEFVNKSFIYAVLEAFIGKDEIPKNSLEIGNPIEILKLAKEYIDYFFERGGHK